MYRQTFQKKLFTILNSGGLDALRDWKVHKRYGYMKRIYEYRTGILILEMRALNSTLHYISTPKDPKKTLGISLPILNILMRNLSKCFSFEVTVRDDTPIRHRFRCGNFITKASIDLFETTIPLTMCGCDWVLVYFNLSDFTRRSYNTNYVETDRVQINGNIHLRRIFFSDKIIEYADLPKDYQIIPVEDKKPGKRVQPAARPPSPNIRNKSSITDIELSKETPKGSVSKLSVSMAVLGGDRRSLASIPSSRKFPDNTSIVSKEEIRSGQSTIELQGDRSDFQSEAATDLPITEDFNDNDNNNDVPIKEEEAS